MNQDIIEKENELKKRDEEINLMEMRIILKKDKIIQLKEAEITNLAKDNLEMKNKIEEIEKENEKIKKENKDLTWKGMYFDIFKIEMRERYRHVEEESDDKDEPQSNMENDVEIEGSDELRKGYHCEQCKFIGKTEAGLKTHRTVKHRRKSGSCNV